jgi:glycosyltransferase involved in cell wall biosynthesis
MISVVLPVRDGLPWLDAQLDALVAQHCDGPWEIVVADNGSSDGSVAAAQGWADRDARLRVIDASKRRGPSAARNAGVRAAHGDLLAFCDADDVVQPGWLQACVDALAQADVVAGTYDMATLNGRGPAETAPAGTSQLGFLPAGLAANLAVRRLAFEAVGGFAEDLVVGEDIDLSWRLQLEGFQFAVARRAVVAKREPAGLAPLFRMGLSYGRCGPALYRRYRHQGAHRDLSGSARSWAWLVLATVGLWRGDVRRRWVRAAGVRLGRLSGSLSKHVFFP